MRDLFFSYIEKIRTFAVEMLSTDSALIFSF